MPKSPDGVDPRCLAQARSPELAEDRRLHKLGWYLNGPYQSGSRILVIGATAGYDAMCRPAPYQVFVFVTGVYVGTLSPELMESRADGALSRIFLKSDTSVTAEYLRYADTDPACCSSQTTRVEFEITTDGSLIRPISASASPNR